MQMLMVRYWATHGSPAELATLPSGMVKIEPRGEDNFTVGSELRKLTRYTVEGLIWGRETLWFDDKQNLVAAISTDAEFDHFEAIRDEYESALGDFVARAGKDNMAALAQISKGISGSRAKTLALVGATLIDGTGEAAVSDSAIVIENGRIVAAGPRSKVKIPDNATVIDETGKTILPGLWDMHAHFEQVEWGPIYLAAGSRRFAIVRMSSSSSARCGMRLRKDAASARDCCWPVWWMDPATGRLECSGSIHPNKRRCGRTSITRRRISAGEDLQLHQAGAAEGGDAGSAPVRNECDWARAGGHHDVRGDRGWAGSD
jgi:hypothetical protein